MRVRRYGTPVVSDSGISSMRFHMKNSSTVSGTLTAATYNLNGGTTSLAGNLGGGTLNVAGGIGTLSGTAT